MKRFLSAFLALSAVLWAEEETKTEREGAEIDGVKLLNRIVEANDAEDITALTGLLEDVVTFAKSAKSAAEVDPIAEELKKSFKVAKGNHGTQKKIIEALGELRSKKASKTLRKIAFMRKPRDEREEELKATAIVALSLLRDPRMVSKLADEMRSRSLVVAKAAMECFKNYGPSKGRVRRNVAEHLMKRMEAEKPAAGQGGKISAEAEKRWQVVAPIIVASMQAICRETTITDVENWRQWWKENRKNKEVWKDEPKG